MMDIGYINSFDLKDKKYIHKSHRLKVVSVNDLIIDLKSWLDANDYIEVTQCISDLINELEEE